MCGMPDHRKIPQGFRQVFQTVCRCIFMLLGTYTVECIVPKVRGNQIALELRQICPDQSH